MSPELSGFIAGAGAMGGAGAVLYALGVLAIRTLDEVFPDFHRGADLEPGWDAEGSRRREKAEGRMICRGCDQPFGPPEFVVPEAERMDGYCERCAEEIIALNLNNRPKFAGRSALIRGAPYKVVCMRCGMHLMGDPACKRTSHGACPECKAAILAEDAQAAPAAHHSPLTTGTGGAR
jgi:hypothetical protein